MSPHSLVLLFPLVGVLAIVATFIIERWWVGPVAIVALFAAVSVALAFAETRTTGRAGGLRGPSDHGGGAHGDGGGDAGGGFAGGGCGGGDGGGGGDGDGGGGGDGGGC